MTCMYLLLPSLPLLSPLPSPLLPPSLSPLSPLPPSLSPLPPSLPPSLLLPTLPQLLCRSTHKLRQRWRIRGELYTNYQLIMQNSLDRFIRSNLLRVYTSLRFAGRITMATVARDEITQSHVPLSTRPHPQQCPCKGSGMCCGSN